MPALALGWLLHQPTVASVLVGARTPSELEAGVGAVERDLPEDILERAGALTASVRARLGDNPDMWMAGAQSRFV
jgi:aryl-alcohol dehydrogenase-like predicted oxidoreductase